MDETTEDYKFLPIRDAIKSINQKVNLIGVIIEFGFPQRTRGTDCCCTLKIIDESYHATGISVNVFAEYMEQLPQIASCGDIVQFCLVQVKAHIGEVNAVFNKRFSSFALYEGKDGQDFVPYQVSSKFRPRDLDRKFIAKLRKWLEDFQLHEEPSNFPLLREIKEGVKINLLCKILHIFEVNKGELLVFAWDGTDAPPVFMPNLSMTEDEMCNPLPLHLECLPLPLETLRTFPTVGSILRLKLHRSVEKKYLQMPAVGKWIKFTNVLCELQYGLWCGVLTTVPRLRYTPDGDSLVVERQRLYKERLDLQNGRTPFWCFPMSICITDVLEINAPFLTLMDILTHSEVTAKFKCIARVVAAVPWKAEDICSPAGVYRFRLTLEDPTARIHAYVISEDGEKLFNGHPPIDILTRKLNKLLGVMVSEDGMVVSNSRRNPPWLKLCLKSYYLHRNDVWGSRQFRVFGTWIVDELL